MMVEEHK